MSSTRHWAVRLLLAMLLPATTLAGSGTTTLCHIPPGNPANKHAITVSEAAAAVHIANHGDEVLPPGGTCGKPADVLPRDNASAAVEICPDGGGEGIRIDISQSGSKRTTSINCNE